MRNKAIRRTLVGAAVATVLVALGAPAGADTGDVTSGSVSFHAAGGAATPTHTMAIPHTPDPCSPALTSGQIDLVTTGTNASGTWTATTPTPIESVVTIPLAGATRISFTFVTASGTYSSTGAPGGYTHALASTGNHVVVEAKMYDVDGSDCSVLRCTTRTRIVLDGGSGFDGTLPGAGGGETARLSGTSDTAGGNALVAVGACSAPYISVAGRHVTALLDTTFP